MHQVSDHLVGDCAVAALQAKIQQPRLEAKSKKLRASLELPTAKLFH